MIENSRLKTALKGIHETMNDLERSVRISQTLERKQFHGALQLLIDKHQLSLNLEQLKYRNEKLKGCDCRSGADKLKLAVVEKDRELANVKRLVKKLTEDNVILARAFEEQNRKRREVVRENAYLLNEIKRKSRVVNRLTRKEKCDENVCEHQTALKELQLHYAAQIAELISIRGKDAFLNNFKRRRGR